MISKINKKGISEVVAAVLLILLTVAAAATLIGFLKPFVEKSLTGSTKCTLYENYFEFEDKLDNGTGIYNYNCWQNETGYYLTGISLKTNGGLTEEQLLKIKGAYLSLSDNSSNSAVFNITDGAPRSDLWIINESGNPLKINNPLETITYVYKSNINYTKAEVSVLLDSGICKSSDTIDLNKCNGVKLF